MNRKVHSNAKFSSTIQVPIRSVQPCSANSSLEGVFRKLDDIDLLLFEMFRERHTFQTNSSGTF